MGNPGFPIPLLAGCALPTPPAGRGSRFTSGTSYYTGFLMLGHIRAGGALPPGRGTTGKPGFPSPLRAGGALLPGRGTRKAGFPSPLRAGGALPPGRGTTGKPGFPSPLRAGGALPPGRGTTGKPGFPSPLRAGGALPPGRGTRKAGFPSPLRASGALPHPPAGGGMGEPGSPMFTLDKVQKRAFQRYSCSTPPHNRPVEL